MAPATTTADAIDDVFDNYDIDDDDDPFRDLDTTLKAPEPSKKRKSDTAAQDGLGIDEEIKVIKKRKPVPKLDETRLLSQLGIPKLRSSYKAKLAPKLKGKGHEFSDVGRMLQFYQLWLDALYPRAKFADGLAMIEKTGHSKRMQVMRKTWIDEGKRKTGDYMADEDYGTPTERRATTGAERETTPAAAAGQHTDNTTNSIFGNGTNRTADDGIDSLFLPKANSNPQDDTASVPGDDDDLGLLLKEQNRPSHTSKSSHLQQNPRLAEDSEGEEDLDALLAEREASRPRAPAQLPTTQQTATTKQAQDGEESEDELDALLAEQEATKPPSTNPIANYRNDDESEDDLDALEAQNATMPSPAEEEEFPLESSQVEDPEAVDVDVEGI